MAIVDETGVTDVAIAKLSMAPTDVLLVFVPDCWSARMILQFEEWMQQRHPDIRMLYLPGIVVALADREVAEQLRTIHQVTLPVSEPPVGWTPEQIADLRF